MAALHERLITYRWLALETCLLGVKSLYLLFPFSLNDLDNVRLDLMGSD
jgi:hypothetical protein